ncbi:hypothetical protein [Weissella confusa]|uniref:hypothetical protein n=1 Tax=Weissella confusa TaxID=1583 RepID=UPI0010805662|nr:hypothetical protein [Weissella confusa]
MTRIINTLKLGGLWLSLCLICIATIIGKNITFILPFVVVFWVLKSKDLPNISKWLTWLYLPLVIAVSVFLKVDLHAVTWDYAAISRSAIDNVGHSMTEIDRSDYLLRYPYNGTYVILMKGIATLCIYTDVDYSTALAIIGGLCIWIAYFFTTKSVSLIQGVKTQVIVQILWISFLPFYQYAPVLYSDTITLSFAALAFFLFLKSMNYNGVFPIKLLLMVGMGFTISVGALFKSTIIILPVAFFIYIVIQKKYLNLLIPDYSSRQTKTR